MKSQRRILFIKNRPGTSFARSWILDELGTHSRIIGDASLLGRILTGEMFDLVILDQRGSKEELIPSIEGMRQYQPHAKLVVVSDSVALSDVQQAIRFNVHDIFLPPFELLPIIERIDAVLAKLNGVRPSQTDAVIHRWSELAATLDGRLDSIFTQIDTAANAAPAEPEKAAASSNESLQEQVGRLSTELASVQAQLAEALEARARLHEQIQQLSVGASALGRAEARARDLEAELTDLRRTGAGPGTDGIELDKLREEFERAQSRITDLERLNQGLLAGSSTEASPESEARIHQLEADLADANSQLEAAGQAFAAEIEQVMAREAEAMTALAAAEEREKQARAVMATAGDAFGRADESIEREREALQAQRDALTAQESAMQDLGRAIEEREERLAARALRVSTIGQSIESEIDRTLHDLGAVTTRLQRIEARRDEIKALLAES